MGVGHGLAGQWRLGVGNGLAGERRLGVGGLRVGYGGLGVREWVLDRLMFPVYGAAPALIAAVVLRCVWLLTELVFSIILYLIPPSAKDTENSSCSGRA